LNSIDFHGVIRYKFTTVDAVALLSEFKPPLTNPYIFNNGNISFRVTYDRSKVCSEIVANNFAINEIFPIKRQIEFISRHFLFGEDNVFTITSTRFRTGFQYEITMGSDSRVVCDNDHTVSLISKGSYRQLIRVLDFEINSVYIDKTNGIVEVYGKNFEIYNPYVLIDNYTIVYRTTYLSASIHIRSPSSNKVELLNENSINVSWSDSVITFEGVNFKNNAGNLELTLDIHRECVCVNPAPCSCNDLSSANKANNPAFFYGGGKLENFTIGVVTCTFSCYNLEGMGGKSCTYIDSPKNQIKNDNRCTNICSKYVRAISDDNLIPTDSLQLECVQECAEREYFTKIKIENEIYQLCQPCDNSCKSCTGPKADSCTVCMEGYDEFCQACRPDNPSCVPCEDTYPKFGDYYQGYCIKDLNLTDNYTRRDMIKVEVIGYAEEYRNRRDPIQLVISSLDSNMIFTFVNWTQEGVDNPVAGLFTQGTNLKEVANISYRYVFMKQDIEPLRVSVRANLYNSSSNEYFSYFNTIIVNHTFNVKTAEFSLHPNPGKVYTDEFQATFNNLMILNGTEIEIKIDYVNIKMDENPTHVKRTSLNERITIYKIRFEDWSSSYQRELRNFTVIAEITKGSEKVICNTLIGLDNIIPPEKKEENIRNHIENMNANEITSEDLASLSMFLVDLRIKSEDDFYCNNSRDCNDGYCKTETGECVCNGDYVDKSCSYKADIFNELKHVEEMIVNFINLLVSETMQIKDPEWSEEFRNNLTGFTSLVLNMVKLSEISGSDMTGDIYSLFVKNSPLLPSSGAREENIPDIKKMVQAATSIMNLKISKDDNISAKIIDITEFINRALGQVANALPLNGKIEFDNDLLMTYISKDNVSPSGPKAYKTNTVEVDVPFFILSQIANNGPIMTKMVEWKMNPYEKSSSNGNNVSSAIVGFSFIDELGGEIKINSANPIRFKIPLFTDEMEELEFKCVYFDPTISGTTNGNLIYKEIDGGKYIGEFLTRGCILADINKEYAICECTHLTDFAVLRAPYEVSSKADIVLPDTPEDKHLSVLYLIKYSGLAI